MKTLKWAVIENKEISCDVETLERNMKVKIPEYTR